MQNSIRDDFQPQCASVQWWRKRKLKAPIWLWIGLVGLLALVATLGVFWKTLDRWGGSLITRLFDDDKVRVTLSEQTTRIVAPLRSDGYVDYVAALDQRASEGVTPENNSAVLFWKAMGPNLIAMSIRAEYFKRLGIALLPPEGKYLSTLREYALRKLTEERNVDSLQAIEEQSDVIRRRPWTRQEFPLAAEWLAANEKPLDLLIEASLRTRRYDPLFAPNDGRVLDALLTYLVEHKRAVHDLRSRALLRIGERDFDGAWMDLLACHRLARLIGQGDLFVDEMFACNIEEGASLGDLALLRSNLSASEAETMQRGLDSLGPMPKTADKVDVGDRFMFLDLTSAMARQGLSDIERISGDGKIRPKGIADSYANVVIKSTVDWDAVFAEGNARYDRFVAALRTVPRQQRLREVQLLEDELDALGAPGKEPLGYGISEARRATSPVRIGLMPLLLVTPSIAGYNSFEDHASMRLDLTRVACALARYRAARGAYPQSVNDLSPEYMATVPLDIFADAPLRFDSTPDGYQLYSIGVNGRDDEAKSYDDAKSNEGWDDLVVRMPAPQR